MLLPASSRLRVEGPLARRSFLTKPQLPGWKRSELLTNSVVQLVVDEEGKLVTPPTLLVSSGYADADKYALEHVRTNRFTSLGELTPGLVIFEWTTLPTNAPAPTATPPP